MTNNDRSLIQQLIKAGKMGVILDFMPDYNLLKSEEVIGQMGNKWCCHPDNAIKKLEQPLPILTESRAKILRRK